MKIEQLLELNNEVDSKILSHKIETVSLNRKEWVEDFADTMVAFEEMTNEADKPLKRPALIWSMIEELMRIVDNGWIDKIKDSQWECSLHGLPKYEKTSCVECNEAMEINVVLNNLIVRTSHE